MVEVRIDLSSSMIKTRIFATLSAFSAPQPSMDRGSASRADREASRGDNIAAMYCTMHDNSPKNRRVQTTCSGIAGVQEHPTGKARGVLLNSCDSSPSQLPEHCNVHIFILF